MQRRPFRIDFECSANSASSHRPARVVSKQGSTTVYANDISGARRVFAGRMGREVAIRNITDMWNK